MEIAVALDLAAITFIPRCLRLFHEVETHVEQRAHAGSLNYEFWIIVSLSLCFMISESKMTTFSVLKK